MRTCDVTTYRFNVHEYHKLGEIGILTEDDHVELIEGELIVQGVPFQFGVADYHKLGEFGIFHEDDPVELLEGEIIVMSPTGYRHSEAVRRLNRRFGRLARGRYHVNVQDPIALDDTSEPEPDIALLRPAPAGYTTGHPRPKDIFLLVEVADSSLDYDRNTKLPLYARAGIREVWIVNLVDNIVEQYRSPSTGAYSDCQQLRAGKKIGVAEFPDVRLDVAGILP
jgi:Uma2 family endonuclease